MQCFGHFTPCVCAPLSSLKTPWPTAHRASFHKAMPSRGEHSAHYANPAAANCIERSKVANKKHRPEGRASLSLSFLFACPTWIWIHRQCARGSGEEPLSSGPDCTSPLLFAAAALKPFRSLKPTTNLNFESRNSHTVLRRSLTCSPPIAKIRTASRPVLQSR